MDDLDKAMTFEEVREILRIVDAAPRGGELTIQLGEASLQLKVTEGSSSISQVPVSPHIGPQSVLESPKKPPPITYQMDDSADTAAPPNISNEVARRTDPIEYENLAAITSPMTGIWYVAPMPGEPPFVSVGEAVEEGQQVGIIEVMKLMTRIVSPCAGTIRQICLANESLAEYGTTLVLIEPSEEVAS